MANFGQLVLTAGGLQAQYDAQSGTPLKFKRIGMGSGNYSGNISSLTKLVTENVSVPISNGYAQSGNYTVEGFFSNESLRTGFAWREIGLFVEDENGNEVLYCYANAGNTYDYIPATTDERYSKYIRIATAIGNATDVSIVENDGLIYVDTVTFNNKVNEINTDLSNHTSNKGNPHSVTKAQVGLDNVPNVSTNDQTPTYSDTSTLATLVSGEKISVAFSKIKLAITNLINHLANKNNPHSVTKSQLGLGNVDNTADANKVVKSAGDSDKLGGQLPSYYATKTEVDNAMPKTGGVSSGNLEVRTSAYPLVMLTNSETSFQAQVMAGSYNARLTARNVAEDYTNERALLVNDNRKNLTEALLLSDKVDGNNAQYKIYGEHNKPTSDDIGALPRTGGRIDGRIWVYTADKADASVGANTSKGEIFISNNIVNGVKTLGSKNSSGTYKNLVQVDDSNNVIYAGGDFYGTVKVPMASVAGDIVRNISVKNSDGIALATQSVYFIRK